MKPRPQVAPKVLRFPFSSADLSGQKLVKAVQSTARSAATIKEHGHTSSVQGHSLVLSQAQNWTQCLNTCPEDIYKTFWFLLLKSFSPLPSVYPLFSTILSALPWTHAFTSQTLIIYLHPQYSDSVTLFPIWGLEHRPSSTRGRWYWCSSRKQGRQTL